MNTYRILTGSCLDTLPMLPAESAQCCVTSPPYWGLRDYGHEGQLGLEKTPQEYVENMVRVFREVRRVLRDDGVLWLNLGDSYASTTKGSGGGAASSGLRKDGRAEDSRIASAALTLSAQRMETVHVNPGLAAKQLVGIPWRVAFALQADGWWLRSDCIWSKPNPMPESVTDRPTKAHEYVFMLSKSERYYFGQDDVRERSESAGRAPGGNHKVDGSRNDGSRDMTIPVADNRNIRTVWQIATEPCKEAHFAVMPRALARRCILAGCPVGGTVLDPFGGAGTVALESVASQRNAIICELNPEYAEIARRRLRVKCRCLPRRQHDRPGVGEGKNRHGPSLSCHHMIDRMRSGVHSKGMKTTTNTQATETNNEYIVRGNYGHVRGNVQATSPEQAIEMVRAERKDTSVGDACGWFAPLTAEQIRERDEEPLTAEVVTDEMRAARAAADAADADMEHPRHSVFRR